MRLALAVIFVVCSGVVAAVILGEYEFTGTTPWLSGAVFGVLVAEIGLSVARRRHRLVAAAAAVAAAGAICWAAYISSGRGVAPYPALAWPAAGLGAVVALWWAWPRRARPVTTAHQEAGASSAASEGVADEGDAAAR